MDKKLAIILPIINYIIFSIGISKITDISIWICNNLDIT